MPAAQQHPEDWFDWAERKLAAWKADATAESSSTSALQVLKFAAEAAHSLGHTCVGAEHLLAGLVRAEFENSSRVLANSGITLPWLRTQIEEAWAHTKERTKGRIPYSPRAKWILQAAKKQAEQRGHPNVTAEDLLLALLGEGAGLPAELFKKLKLDREQIRTEILSASP